MSTSAAGDPAADPFEAAARRDLLIALGAILVAPLALAVSAFCAVSHAKDPPHPIKRWLVLVAVTDVVVAGCLIAMVTVPAIQRSVADHSPHPRIGIDIADTDEGVRVVAVTPGSPAEAAGLQPGDVVVDIDDHPVASADELRADVAASKEGAPRAMHVRRADAPAMTVEVIPARAGPSKQGLFDKIERSPASGPSPGALVAFSMIALLAVVGKIRGGRALPGLVAASALAVSFGLSYAVVVLLERAGALSLGAMLLALGAGTASMGVVGWAGTRLVAGAARSGHARMLPTAGRALVYAMGTGLRVGLIITVVSALVHLPVAGSSEAFGPLTGGGPQGILLFAVVAVVIAPLAEEALFRGLLLPWITTWASERAALWTSAAVFAAGHLVYGANVLVTFAYGAALGWARLASGRIRAGVCTHAAINSLAVIALLVSSARPS